jgi:hypothetical protein
MAGKVFAVMNVDLFFADSRSLSLYLTMQT